MLEAKELDLDAVLKEILADPAAYNAACAASRDESRRMTDTPLVVEGERQRNEVCRAIYIRITSPARWLGFDSSDDEAKGAINRAICKWSRIPFVKDDKGTFGFESAAGVMGYLRTVARNDLIKLSNKPTRQAEFEQRVMPASEILENERSEDIGRNDEDVESLAKLEFHPKRFGDIPLNVLYCLAIGIPEEKIASYLCTESSPVKPTKQNGRSYMYSQPKSAQSSMNNSSRRLNYAKAGIAKQMDRIFGSDYRGKAKQSEVIDFLRQIDEKKTTKTYQNEESERTKAVPFLTTIREASEFFVDFYVEPSELIPGESTDCFLVIPCKRYENFVGRVERARLDANKQQS
jgi:hypothetical protein